ncbi:MAG: transcription antitermination factor NusB [Cyclobacteriaceae bacterium]|nr:transcription antitermination factor NusB [Cyclobacteriaceae bacterium]
MLNRRTLRIKIMQSLFAFGQCKEANHLLAHDLIDERFQPDLNSMQPQDKELLRKQKKVAMQLFEKKYKGKETEESPDPRISSAVEDALELFNKQVKKDQSFLSKNIIIEIEKLTGLYHSVLSLLTEFAALAAAEKKVDHSHFANHPLITAISSHAELTAALLKTGSLWQKHKDSVRSWFKEVIKEDNDYQEYIAGRKPTPDDQKAIIKHLVRKRILGAGPINDFFEAEDIRWAEDREIIKSLVDKTIKSFNGSEFTLQKLSLDWEDDKLFVNKLFTNTIELDEKYKQLIAQNTRNWEVDRLPLTDRIILEMALAEMVSFPNIPVKVTINEYIELTKEYSTPKSRQFINGILDVMSKSMKDSGAIKKSGRGLIDNK